MGVNAHGSGFAVPVEVDLLDDDTRAFALAFPPLFRLHTVFALDENGEVLRTLPIFP
ncbi:MAG TPA: hypothetical protein VM284_07110 [Candidatus Limnocylindria bacterium]|nr:hypothetical protein [Candidatus Limnocylindria bacterium]